jgi:hypothetical protein
MKSRRIRTVSVRIDKLTTSIENTLSGEIFQTQVIPASQDDMVSLLDENWLFDWRTEFRSMEGKVYKLTTRENPSIIHGLIHTSDRSDHVFINLVESAQVNVGKNKMYAGVAGNLIAFACKQSFESGYNGIVSFTAKTQLMAHYEKELGAKRFSYNQMFIETADARSLVARYFPDFKR